jgi:hypothetical protein
MMASAAIPELRLLLACARVELGEVHRGEIARALDDGIDWARALRLARWHGLRPLLHRHLGAMDAGRVPRPVLVELWADAEAIARRNRALQAELVRIAALLDARSVPALPYKGPTLALAAYGDLALREFGDLDILVARDDLLAARDALCAAGYVEEYPLQPQVLAAFIASGAQYHLVLRSPALGHLVELHWKTDTDFPVERLDHPRGREGGAGVGLHRFCAEDLLLVLCIHGSKHGWSSLGWLVDVAELLAAKDAMDWARFCGRAQALGCSRRVGVGLRLANELLGAPLASAPRGLAARADVARAAVAILPGILATEPDSPGPFQGLALCLALAEDPRERIRLVYRAVCLPSLVEWMRWPLPRRLFFAYPLIRVGRLFAKHSLRAGGALLPRRRLHS